MAHVIAHIENDAGTKTIRVTPRLAPYAAEAKFNLRSPREGCKLTKGYADYPK